MKVAIITEGFHGTGYGHLTRCLSIYQAFEEKNIIPLLIANCDENGKKFIPCVNLFQLNWLENTSELIREIKDFDIAVIDSYLAPIEIYEKIYKSVKKVIYIDDYIRLDYPPGIIANGTIGAENLPYKKDDQHNYLLGIDYMPLRKEFWDVDVQDRKNTEIKNVLITFGGQDFRELTFPVLDSLISTYPALNFHVIKPIRRNNTESNYYRNNVTFYSSLNAKEMLNLMLKADLAVTAAGQTTYELARIGVPTVAIGVAENQKYNIKGWKNEGFIGKENWYFQDDLFVSIGHQFNAFLNSGLIYLKNYCDGQGARRIVQETLYQT
ncbi:MAG: UDP-2,4-diacetamido-2,4,6-trideoxy-beta-L-altropyranose hydrolase [Ignavibacteriales bacterium]|nr:UDP-2,4-diacetamido-2,4,6-trideoxy-beta-L-altropyranose hydrolase [Ignavibacteriales bacterium]